MSKRKKTTVNEGEVYETEDVADIGDTEVTETTNGMESKEAMKETEKKMVEESKPVVHEIGGMSFVRAGNRIFNMAHVVSIDIGPPYSDAVHPVVKLVMVHGTVVVLNKTETYAIMEALGDCCAKETKARDEAIENI